MEQQPLIPGTPGSKRPGLEQCGIHTNKQVFWNLSAASLYEEAILRKEGQMAEQGPLVVRTGEHTGRSPKDKFFVREPSSEKDIAWGKVNKGIDPAYFDRLFERVRAYLTDKDLFVQDCFAGADPDYRLPVRIVSEMAWQSLFAHILFREATPEELDTHIPEFTVIAAPFCSADPQVDGTRSPVFILINFARKLILIGGTIYAGEIKKSIFTILNYLLPQRGVMPMHCSANIGTGEDVALFFGLSGTGKTTLSADPERQLIGDDEHGWSDNGVFNFEGGCYAKVINLSAEAEPEIYSTTRRFGTVLENVVMDPVSRVLDLTDDSLTENTRAAYPLSFIPNTVPAGHAGHPNTIIFLTADAFGVMPPLSKLTREQALYHFLSGYTAKVAGTEKGVKDPEATFSTCFGAPFMALHPTVYADLLGKKIDQHNVACWLVNTGWIGGPFGVGNRINIANTRAMIRAILDGRLADVPTTTDPIFGLHIPTACPNVPEKILLPRNTWSDPAAYDTKAKELAKLFHKNFTQFTEHVSSEISKAGPLA